MSRIVNAASLAREVLRDALGARLRARGIVLAAAGAPRRSGGADRADDGIARPQRNAARRGRDVRQELRPDRDALRLRCALAVFGRGHPVAQRGVGLPDAVFGRVGRGAVVAHRGLDAAGGVDDGHAHVLLVLAALLERRRGRFERRIGRDGRLAHHGLRARVAEGERAGHQRGNDEDLHGRLLPFHATSNSPAAPMPPPMHIVTTTYFTPRRLPSMSACPVRRAPETPYGWPTAIAPPFTLRRSSGMPSLSRQ